MTQPATAGEPTGATAQPLPTRRSLRAAGSHHAAAVGHPVRVPRWLRLAGQGCALALIAGGTTAFAGMHKTVTVDVDGTPVQASVFGRTVADVLARSGVEVGDADLVAPALGDAVRTGSQIVVRHSRPVTLEVDGTEQTVWTTAATVGDVVADLGARADGALVSTSRSTELGRVPVVRVSTMKTVHVVVDGQVIDGTTNGATVEDALGEIGIVLGEGDRLSVPLDAPVADGLVVLVSRVAAADGTETVTAAYPTQEVPDPTLPEGTRVVSKHGKVGTKVVTYSAGAIGGLEVSRTVLTEVVVSEPVAEVVRVGTMKVPAAAAVTPGSARAVAQQLASARGWGADQFACLDSLWNRESGWRVDAANPSGAYGIPQALPGSRMASVGSDWRTNPVTQITWGLSYIAGRYSTPCSAWSSFQAKGWY